jgi:hypothetical protein
MDEAMQDERKQSEDAMIMMIEQVNELFFFLSSGFWALVSRARGSYMNITVASGKFKF